MPKFRSGILINSAHCLGVVHYRLLSYLKAMRADTDAAIEAFGKNEQVKKVFWTLFISMAGLVLAQVMDPVIAQQIVGLITGMGG